MFSKQEITRLKEITILPDAEILASSGPDRGAGSENAGWEFKTEWNSDQYLQWVTPRLSASFQALGGRESDLTFSRYLDGDTETLKIQTIPQGPRLRVRINLEVYAD
jgi:hypothetical protein